MIWQQKSSCLLRYSEFHILSYVCRAVLKQSDVFICVYVACLHFCNNLSIIMLVILKQVMPRKLLRSHHLATCTCADVGQSFSSVGAHTFCCTHTFMGSYNVNHAGLSCPLSAFPWWVYDQSKWCQKSKAFIPARHCYVITLFLEPFSYTYKSSSM